MNVEIQVRAKQSLTPKDAWWSVQRHTTDIACASAEPVVADGVWTSEKNIWIGVQTADCAPVCLWGEGKIIVVHAGWRGLVRGIIENALKMFQSTPQCWVGPLYERFEIKKDDCYNEIKERFGERFFEIENGNIYFCFSDALKSILPQNTEWDGRNTYDDESLASWRRDKHYDFANWTMIRMMDCE